MHDDEVELSPQTLRKLIADQFPQWAHLPLTHQPAAGTVNAIFRLGEDMVVRCPLRRMAASEARSWLMAESAAQEELAGVSPVATPRPLAMGSPGRGYPMPFVVQTWVPGRVPRVGEAVQSAGLADDLAHLIRALRGSPLHGRTFTGAGRGGALPDHDAWMETCIRLNAPWFDPATTKRMWTDLRELPREDPDVMTHGDLVPGNILIDEGRLVGLLDGGGFGPADPALDLVSAWHLVDETRRRRMRSALHASDLQWERGRAWAFAQAMGLVHYYFSTHPDMHALGLRTMQQLMTSE